MSKIAELRVPLSVDVGGSGAEHAAEGADGAADGAAGVNEVLGEAAPEASR